MSDDATLRHLGDGIAEEVTNQLVGRPGLDVASRTSAFQAREGKDAGAIARALGVSYIVEGSVRPFGDQIRLTAQLIRAEDGFHVWSETFDLAANSSPVEQDDTIRTVSLMVNGYVDLDRRLASARGQTANDEAYRHFATALRLRTQMNTGGTSQLGAMRQVLEEVEHAIALDPGLVDAYWVRANAYFNRVDDVQWDVAVREARRSIDAGLALQPDKPYFAQLALIQMTELDLTAAQQTLERIRSIDPDNRYLNQCFAYLAMQRGRSDEAMRYWQQDFEKNPYASNSHVWYGFLLVRRVISPLLIVSMTRRSASLREAPLKCGSRSPELWMRPHSRVTWRRPEHCSSRYGPDTSTPSAGVRSRASATGHETEARELLTRCLRPGHRSQSRRLDLLCSEGLRLHAGVATPGNRRQKFTCAQDRSHTECISRSEPTTRLHRCAQVPRFTAAFTIAPQRNANGGRARRIRRSFMVLPNDVVQPQAKWPSRLLDRSVRHQADSSRE